MKTYRLIIIVSAMLATLTANAQRGDIDSDLQYAEYLVNNGKGALAYPELNKIISQCVLPPRSQLL